ncbi:MAG: hypothetical protein KAI47_27495 [Deltaproteobacteria bacterium]|nr:hypothetical protein [Deltaproteobacteria bacterium]
MLLFAYAFITLAACSGGGGASVDVLSGHDGRGDRGGDEGSVVDHAIADQRVDVFSPLPGFGALTGECGVLDDDEWGAPTPFFFSNALDFGSAGFDKNLLSPGGQQILSEGNLGGNSLHSEIFSYEVLHRCELATLLKTEAKIDYTDVGGKKTDLLVSIDGRKIGVSVTRAVHFPKGQPYTEAEAQTLLHKKLSDIPLSEANAVAADAWGRSILHVIAWDAQHAQVVKDVFAALDVQVKAKTILVVTVTNGTDDYIY